MDEMSRLKKLSGITEQSQKYFMVTLRWSQHEQDHYIVPASSRQEAEELVRAKWDGNANGPTGGIHASYELKMFGGK